MSGFPSAFCHYNCVQMSVILKKFKLHYKEHFNLHLIAFSISFFRFLCGFKKKILPTRRNYLIWTIWLEVGYVAASKDTALNFLIHNWCNAPFLVLCLMYLDWIEKNADQKKPCIVTRFTQWFFLDRADSYIMFYYRNSFNDKFENVINK